MKQKLKNLLCSAALLLGATAATAQGLQNIIVEEFHTVTQADADAYNNDHGAGSFPLVAGMKTYRVYVDMAPNYRLTSVFATPNSPLSVNTTTTFWNDDNWGSEGPGQTRRLDEGNLFDSFITINTASTSSTGTTPCGATAHTSQFGVQRTADTNGDLFTCGVYPGFTGADGHIPVPFAMDPLVFLGTINYQALTSDPAPAGSFGYSNALYGYTGGITGVDPSGSNIAFIGQFTTDGTFSFNLNVALILPSPSTATEEYVHTSPNVGQIQSSLLIFPQPNLDCNGVPGGPAVPGTSCNDNNACTINDVFDANCNCAGTFQDTDSDGVCDVNDPCPTQANVVPGQSCNDGDACTINDVVTANCGCAGTFQDTDSDGVCDASDPCPTQANVVPGQSCNDGDACTINDVVTANCGCAGTFQDTDSDGVCDASDPCPTQANVVPGQSCNDGDACTINDVVTANCGCAGTFQDTDSDGVCDASDPCPTQANVVPGQSCNDGDACTINDVVTANCGCAGTFQDSDSDGTCDANDACPNLAFLVNGNPCDDGNALTINDVVTNCICAGTLLGNDCEGVPGGPAQPGTACNDNNPLTGNDTWDANCLCAGLLIDCEGTPGGTALPGTACNDNDPLTGNDTWDANCVCAGLVIDCEGTPGGTALPGTACNDLNPNTSNDVWSANCVCAGVLANDCEGTPGGPAQPGTACNDNNPLTGNDTWDANCVCAGLLIDCEGTPGGTALPGTACNDNNPLTGNDTWDANCVCAGLLIDCEGTPGGAALPGTACNDNNACTINDVYDANCNCSGTFEDTDSDGVCDANDNCPTVTGQIGSACDDDNANTINDQLNAACQCVGTPVGPGCDFNELEIEVVNDAVSIVTYEIREQGTNNLAANGTVNPPSGTYTLDICLPDGCYYLVVTDNGGDGLVGGGYVLRTLIGQRIIDNTGNMTVSPSRIEGNEGFCLPLGTDRFKFSSCDKLDWRFGEVVAAETNPLVSAQYGINNANSGYQIWWYNPNGGYSFKRFQSHNTTNSLPASPSRAAHFVINGWIGNQLQENVLYNMKVRARVNGTYSTWGPACNFTMNELRAQCPLAKLNDVPGSQYLSCDQSRNWGLGNIVSARPVSRVSASGVGTQNANRYQFRFRLPDESLVTVRTSSSYHLPLNWSVNPLVPGTTYLVDVRASFDNGATWCTDFIQPSVDPWGEICTLTINGGGNLVEESGNATGEQEARMQMYPNPNRGDQLFLSLSNVEEGVESINVDIYDSFGKRVAQRTIGVQDGFVNTTLDLNGELSAGVYMVSIAAGERAITERLVIQP